MGFRSAAFQAFLSAVALVDGCDTATLTGATQLTGRSGRIQRLDPGGATRTVDLPGPSEGVADTNGHWFVVQNTADAAENLTMRDPANATVGTLTKGQTGLFWGTGTTYVQVFAAGGPTGSTSAGEGASLVGIQDVGTYYTGTEVEAALQELGASRAQLAATTNGDGASLIGIEDVGTYFTGTDVEAALDELGESRADLALATTGKGASLVTMENASGGLLDGTVEDGLTELSTVISLSAAAEAGNVIAVTVQGPAKAARYLARVYDAAMLLAESTAFTCAETGTGSEISTTAKASLLFATDATGAAEISVTDVLGASSAQVYLVVTPLAQQASALSGPGGYLSITFDGA